MDRPSDTAVAESQALKMSPFEAMEQIAGPLIQLTLLPVRYFSIAFEETMAVMEKADGFPQPESTPKGDST
jgi:hypothetical protein